MEEKQSQTSTFIGMGLIFLLLFLWMQYSAPPKKETPPPAKKLTFAEAALALTPDAGARGGTWWRNGGRGPWQH